MAAKGHILVVDAGTSAARCLVFDERGETVGACARPWSYLAEDDAPSLARAFDPKALWQTVCDIIKGGLANAGVPPERTAAVSVTSQRQACVFLDAEGNAIYAGPNLDLRAVFEGAAIDDEMRDRVYHTTGHLPSFFFAPAKLRWFQANRSESYARIACVLTLADWLVWRLTGTLASTPTLAGEAGLLDIHRRSWCGDLLGEMGLTIAPVPLIEAGTMAGEVNAGASVETSLPEGTPVATSGADTQCGLLGMGVVDEGQVGIVAGWSAPLQMVTTRPVLSPEGKTWAGCFLDSGKWVLESTAGDLGNSYRWLGETLYGDAEDSFQQMEKLAGTVPIGSEGVVVYPGPARMDMASLGMRAGGFLMPVPLTFSDVGRGHLVRASLEAMAFTMKANLLQTEELAVIQAADVSIGGGLTRTFAFVQMLADVLGRRVKASRAIDVSAVGAHLCARTALGEFGSLDEAASSVRPGPRVVEPDPRDSAEYRDHFDRWLELSDQLQGLGM